MSGKEGSRSKPAPSRSLTQEQLLARGEGELPGWLGEIDKIAPGLVDSLICLCHHQKTIKNPEDEREGSVWDLFLETLEGDSIKNWYQAGAGLEEESSYLKISKKSKLGQRIRKISRDRSLGMFCQSFENFVAPINRHGLLLDVWHSRLGNYAVGLNFFLPKRSFGLQRAIVLASLGRAIEQQANQIIKAEIQRRDQGIRVTCPSEGNPLPGIKIEKLAYLFGAREWINTKLGEAVGVLKGGPFTESDWRVFHIALFGTSRIEGFSHLGKSMEPVWKALDEGLFAKAGGEMIDVMAKYPGAFSREACLWLTAQQWPTTRTGQEPFEAAEKRQPSEEEEPDQRSGERQGKTLAEYLEEDEQLKKKIRKAEVVLQSLIIRKIIGPRVYLGSIDLGSEREILETERDLTGRYFAKLSADKTRYSGEEQWPYLRLRLISLGCLFLVHPRNRRILKRELEERNYSPTTIEELFRLFDQKPLLLGREKYLQGEIRTKRRLEKGKKEPEEKP
ncbi:MAG TPA: hypothetical protein VMX77_01355 [Candidatus Bathyarchaeia archaeon]|nr:hypothetical protein [Candidatus Bathyarchaeia archaeon]